MEGSQWGRAEGSMGEKLQGIRNINCRYKIGRGRLRIVWEMEKPKNLYVGTCGHELRWGNYSGRGGTGQRGIKGENGITVVT